MADSSKDFGTDLDLEDQTPLRSVVTEIHEMHEELLAVGFPLPVANQIVGHILYDVMSSRFMDDDEDDEEDEDGADT